MRLDQGGQAQAGHEFRKEIINLFEILYTLFIYLGADRHHGGVLLQDGFNVCDLMRL